ncbi:HsdM family class I SAM-dependent methyltransferase [Bacillus sp. FSL K6-0067]|uniref:HsdM family class I SAM-dependent methyltransferase n=1 Tax=Bacillus sp. FSL K6-0067 TaxID=2921412 RepID=UPI00077A6AF6|nr:N-6 DNA methylase [Bacillus cereus]KXY34998.1 hypothetical protein AT267_21840 [Bacillus cereus]
MKQQYYTPRSLARLLVDLINLEEPQNIIDICAGSWNLLDAASDKWPKAELSGVDIDENSYKSFIQDGRMFSFEAIEKENFFDLVLANPPFRYEEKDSNVIEQIERHTAAFHFNGYIYTRLESTMMICNTLLVKPNGILAAIVPNGIINSESQQRLRVFISRAFHLEKLIELPSNAFGKKDIHTSIIILRKVSCSNRKETEIYKAINCDKAYALQYKYSIEAEEILKGNWNVLSKNKILEKNDYRIMRNNISSNKLVDKKENYFFPVIHSSAISKDGKIRLDKMRYTQYRPGKPISTKKGDIVMIRVGRNCGLFSIINKEINLYTSDCILIIRANSEKSRMNIINVLKSDYLNQIKKGVTTKYITKKDLNFVLG